MNCKVLPGTAEAEFTLTYRALVMKPFKNEVVDAIVDKVGKVCSINFTYLLIILRPNMLI